MATEPKCLGYTENYKHCPTCEFKNGPVDGKRKICYSTKYVMAKPCPTCGGYYPGDCKCDQPCFCDSCNTQRELDEQDEYDCSEPADCW